MKAFKFLHIDVFAQRPLEGNPLAVFPNATGLTDDQMHSIARELNLSETTFVFPRDKAIESTKGIRTRIFTPQEELPFAGHPTLGTSWVLRNGKDQVLLDLNVGTIPVSFSSQDGKLFGEMTQQEPKWGMTHELAIVASALGVEKSDLVAPIETVSTGVPFAIACFKSLEKLRSFKLD